MRNILITIILTLILIIFYYLELEYQVVQYGVYLLLIFIISIIVIYHKKIIWSIKFDILFIKFFIGGIVYILFLALIFKGKIIFEPTKLKTILTLNFLVVPFFEELFFRFFFFEKLKNLSTTKIIVLSSLMFSIAHWFSNDGLFYIFIFGVLIGIYYHKAKSITMVYFLHLFLNIIGLFFIFN